MENKLILTSFSEEQFKKFIEDSIKKAISNSSSDKENSKLGDYIEEKEAKQLLGRKTTWFWNLRTSNQLPFYKVGNKVYYKLSDIQNLLTINKK